jgi:sugar phosphate isomerase/epimerase
MTSRREFLVTVGGAALAAALPAPLRRRLGPPLFPISVLTDEISQDLGHACEIAAREFGIGYVELRAAHGKNIMSWDSGEVAAAQRILKRFDLRVSELASPIFKVDWPGAPRSPESPSGPQYAADFTYAQQDELLERAIDLARAFDTQYVRIFDFWRLDDQAPYRDAIDDRLRRAAITAGRGGVTLNLENELACNTATGAEAGRLLAAVREPSLKLNWDPGNARARGETPYPDGYDRVPKDRIAHLHCKDAVPTSDGKTAWAAMGSGVIDWVGQFRALRRDGYRGVVSLETHWRGAGLTAEESSRRSMAGMKELLRKAEEGS